MTDTTPVSGDILTPGVALAIVDTFAKFKECASPKNKRSRDPDHAPFGGVFLTPGVGLVVVDALAKLNERSYIHSRNIFMKGFKI